jgi:glycerol uptake facilitator-like aquaporin
VAEGVGTALLVAAIVGSGVMAERLAGGNAALTLLANSLATGAALIALIFHLRADLRSCRRLRITVQRSAELILR